MLRLRVLAAATFTVAAPLVLFLPARTAAAQPRASAAAPGPAASAVNGLPDDSVLVRALTFRSIGPALMGGRIVEIAVAQNPKTVRGGRLGTVLYIAAATGGVWKSVNAGLTWTPVFDSVRVGSVGAVAVAPSNSDIVWVGTGEANNMRSSSWGTGLYKSTDGGRTWSAPMLPRSQHIGRIVIDPRDPSVVYVAAAGPLWASGGERGLFKTTDGGRTWTNTKSISPNTGFIDVVMDPSNPDVLYAAAQMRERREFGFLPAGPEAGIYKTTDAGKTWTQLTHGLPTGELGRIGISVCASKPATVYSIIHARGAANGVYRSDDAGANWRHVNGTNATAWYYGQIRCDPTDPEHVIRLSANSGESYDGGRTWTGFAGGGAPGGVPGVHSDHHALWINEEAPEHMILGTDGGLYFSYDRGRTWDHVENIPLAQYYSISVDDDQPFYNVYGGLQDNQSWFGPTRSRNAYGPTNADWYRTHGGDGFYVVPDPWDRNIVYAEMQGGGVVRYDARIGQNKNIKPVPKPGERHRYNWSAPILPSRHDRNTVYMAANFLFRSVDRGDTWQTLGPDLTRNIDRNKLPIRGAVPDSTALGRNEGTAEFSNITSIDESPLRAGLLVVGTDDGLIQVSRDGGKTWAKTSVFPSVPETTYVSRVLFSRASEGTIYATLDGHRSNDFRPYVVKSTDYGRTWTSITGDLPDGGSVQVIREHPRESKLLFVGTEFGVYCTIDGGGHWLPLRSGIPGVPVHDLAIQARANDLVVGTHGRGIYILDDLTPLELLARARQSERAFMFPIADAMLFTPNASRSSGMGSRGFAGQNPPPGPRVAWLLHDVPAESKVTLSIVDGAGTVVRELAQAPRPGLYRTTWDMRVGPPLTGPVRTDSATGGRGGRGGGRGGGAAPDTAEGRGGGPGGAGRAGGGGGRGGQGDDTFAALPGTYTARLTIAAPNAAPAVFDRPLVLRRDPMVVLSDDDLRQLYVFRLNVVRAQRTLRERQAQLDSTQVAFAEIRRAADSAGTKLPPAVKQGIDSLQKELADILAQLGSAQGGRGGGAGRAGGGGAGRAGGGGEAPGRAGGEAPGRAGGEATGRAAGAGGDDDQAALPATPSTTTIQARLGTTTEMLNTTFNPNDGQRRTLQMIPGELAKQGDRLNAALRTRIPALRKALADAGITVGGVRTP